jgi:hypothetical protein
MTPKNANRWKETLQSLCAIAVLVALFWICRQGLPTRVSSDGGAMEASSLTVAPDGEAYVGYWDDAYVDAEEKKDYGDILAMPVCTDLSNSIQTLQGVRNKLLRVAAHQDAQTVLSAVGEYREAVQEVQTGFARLRVHVAPDDFPHVSQELLESPGPGDGEALTPCELGRFAEEIWQ